MNVKEDGAGSPSHSPALKLHGPGERSNYANATWSGRVASDGRPAASGGLLRLSGLIGESVTDGPGLRAVVFVQGCSRHCPGCHNPETWDPDGGSPWDVDDLWAELSGLRLLQGVTFSGGEPFEQPRALARLAGAIKDHGWDLVVYTGYTWEELQARRREEPEVDRLLSLTDILVDGPFVLSERDISLPFRGSRNQRLLDLRRSEAAGRPVPWETIKW